MTWEWQTEDSNSIASGHEFLFWMLNSAEGQSGVVNWLTVSTLCVCACVYIYMCIYICIYTHI